MVDIVGRISQRAQLSRWLGGAIDGQPVVIVVEGTPGVGKSTLVDWLINESSTRGVIAHCVTVPEEGDVGGEGGTHVVGRLEGDRPPLRPAAAGPGDEWDVAPVAPVEDLLDGRLAHG